MIQRLLVQTSGETAVDTDNLPFFHKGCMYLNYSSEFVPPTV